MPSRPVTGIVYLYLNTTKQKIWMNFFNDRSDEKINLLALCFLRRGCTYTPKSHDDWDKTQVRKKNDGIMISEETSEN
jgi:hypothetical protein